MNENVQSARHFLHYPWAIKKKWEASCLKDWFDWCVNQRKCEEWVLVNGLLVHMIWESQTDRYHVNTSYFRFREHWSRDKHLENIFACRSNHLLLLLFIYFILLLSSQTNNKCRFFLFLSFLCCSTQPCI